VVSLTNYSFIHFQILVTSDVTILFLSVLLPVLCLVAQIPLLHMYHLLLELMVIWAQSLDKSYVKPQFFENLTATVFFSTTTWKLIPQNLQSTHICLTVTHMVPHICMMHLAFILQTCLNQNNHISLSVLKLCLTGFHLLTDFFLIPTVVVFLTVLVSAHWARMKGSLMTEKHQQSGILFTDNYIVILDI